MFKSKPIDDPFKTSLCIVQLNKIDSYECQELTQALLCPGEIVLMAFKGVRAYVFFTASRVLVVKIKGISGNEKCIVSVNYDQICTYALTTNNIKLVEALTLHFIIRQYQHPLVLQFDACESMHFLMEILSGHPIHQQ